MCALKAEAGGSDVVGWGAVSGRPLSARSPLRAPGCFVAGSAPAAANSVSTPVAATSAAATPVVASPMVAPATVGGVPVALVQLEMSGSSAAVRQLGLNLAPKPLGEDVSM